jgi:hypothetical protein
VATSRISIDGSIITYHTEKNPKTYEFSPLEFDQRTNDQGTQPLLTEGIKKPMFNDQVLFNSGEGEPDAAT